jgi:hypothetical protein
MTHAHSLMMVAVQVDLQQVPQVLFQLSDAVLNVLIWHQCLWHVGEPATTQHSQH